MTELVSQLLKTTSTVIGVASIKKLVHSNADFGLMPPTQRALWLGAIAEFGSRSGVGPKQVSDFISQCLKKRSYFLA
jgi:hypothetical protein